MSHLSYSVHKTERLLRRRRRRVLFSVVGLVAVVGVVIGASYLWLYLQWQKTQIDDPNVISALESTMATNLFPSPEGTMNILVAGVDMRGDWEATRSDSMLLVHSDPASNYLSVLSLPRDLRVEIPGQGTGKLNASFVFGGPELAIQTIENLTGVDLTHYMEIDFAAFRALTDAVGGVYVDVDKHYLQTGGDMKKCDILPGYQKLDGRNGLDYVRFRNDANMDFGRQQRQQLFLSSLREQAMGWDLGLKLPAVITALTDNIQTTISFDEIQRLAYWAITKLSGNQIRQTVLKAHLQYIDGESFVVTSDDDLQKTVQSFMNAPSDSGSDTEVTVASSGSTTVTTAASSGVSIDSSQFMTDPSRIVGASAWKQTATEIPFAVMAPGYIPNNYIYFDRNPQSGPGYTIDIGGDIAKGLKVIYQLQANGEPQPEYLGIMATTWLDAPAASPGREFEYNGTTYTIVRSHDQVERIWWKTDEVLYWVSNTIMHTLSTEELVKVAASMITIDGGTAQ